MATVLAPSGRSALLARSPSSTRVATILKGDNWLLKRELDAVCDHVEIPWQEVRRTEIELPEGARWDFFGKDLTETIRTRWSQWEMGEEGLTSKARMSRSLGVYDWVMQEKPQAVVVWTDAYPELRAACMAAKALGIPSFEVVHGGFHVYVHGHWELKSFVDWHLGSWEYRAWKQFFEVGGECVATGLPNMDVWARQDVASLRIKARHELQIPDIATVVVYLGDTPFERTAWQDRGLAEGAFLQFLKDWRTARKIIPNPHLLFKQHPYDRAHTLAWYEGLVKDVAKIEDNYTLIDDNLVLALMAGDLLVGPRSTAMISGLLLWIPSLIVDYTPFFEEHLYRGMGFEVARRPEEVLSKLVGICTDSQRMLELIGETAKGEKWFAGAPGASQRAVSVIVKIAEGKEIGEEDWCPASLSA